MKAETILKKLKTHTAKWTDDCQGKKDFDGEVLSISSRFYPPSYSRDGQTFSAMSSLNLYGTDDSYAEVVRGDFKGATEEEVKAKVENWASAQWNRAVRALAAEFDHQAE